MRETLLHIGGKTPLHVPATACIHCGFDKEQTMQTPLAFALASALALSLAAGCGGDDGDESTEGPEGPAVADMVPPVETRGSVDVGRDVFRFETFGNERFWTDAARLQQGVMAARVTPIQALQLGLSVDIEALDGATQAALAAELKTDLSPTNAPLLNNPDTTVALVNANAVIGIVAKDSNGDGTIDIRNGDKTGASCALCHAITDASAFALPNGGSIGKRLDGLAVHSLDFGKLLAAAQNSRAYYPVLQLALDANGGKTLGRAPTGLTENSTEAEVDAFLSNPDFYPVGMFDDTVDGNGDPMKNSALFRQDLAAPFGSEGAIARLENFSNLVYTALLDPTTLTTPGGRAFLRTLGGEAAGSEIADDYVKVLQATGVTGYPFVTAAPHPMPGSEEAPLGIRVDDDRLFAMNAYLVSLAAPPGTTEDATAVARGRQLFRANGQCTTCHNVDQGKAVPDFIVAMKTIFPGDNPVTLLPQRDPPLNPILDTAGSVFDDKMAVVNASLRGDIRGTALPLLLDLVRKPNLLHDSSVPSMEALLDPARGGMAPHPFYLANADDRTAMTAFLRSLGTTGN